MIDEESRLPVEAKPGTNLYGEGLLYDYSKFVTTLALLSLGGVVTLTQAGDADDLKLWKLGLVIGAISAGGVLALTTASGVVDARAAGKEPSRRLPLQLKIALGLIALGLGAFLQMWWQILR
jgi:hypothetical protein